MTTTTWTIEDREVRLPVEVREATSVFATFLVPAPAMKWLLPPELTPLQAIPGRAVCTIVGVDYRDGDLGAYHEVGVCFLIRPPGTRLDVLAMARNRAPEAGFGLRPARLFPHPTLCPLESPLPQ